MRGTYLISVPFPSIHKSQSGLLSRVLMCSRGGGRRRKEGEGWTLDCYSHNPSRIHRVVWEKEEGKRRRLEGIFKISCPRIPVRISSCWFYFRFLLVTWWRLYPMFWSSDLMYLWWMRSVVNITWYLKSFLEDPYAFCKEVLRSWPLCLPASADLDSRRV